MISLPYPAAARTACCNHHRKETPEQGNERVLQPPVGPLEQSIDRPSSGQHLAGYNSCGTHTVKPRQALPLATWCSSGGSGGGGCGGAQRKARVLSRPLGGHGLGLGVELRAWDGWGGRRCRWPSVSHGVDVMQCITCVNNVFVR